MLPTISRLAASVTVVAVLGAVPKLARAQAQRATVEVVGRAEGAVGERLVYLLREEFQRSEAFRLVENSGARMQLVVSTLPKDESAPNAAAVYAVVWNMVIPSANGAEPPPYFIDTTVGYAGANVVQQATQTIVARTEKMVVDFRRSARLPASPP